MENAKNQVPINLVSSSKMTRHLQKCKVQAKRAPGEIYGGGRGVGGEGGRGAFLRVGDESRSTEAALISPGQRAANKEAEG